MAPGSDVFTLVLPNGAINTNVPNVAKGVKFLCSGSGPSFELVLTKFYSSVPGDGKASFDAYQLVNPSITVAEAMLKASHRVYLCWMVNGTPTEVAEIPQDNTSVQVTGLTRGRNYFFKIVSDGGTYYSTSGIPVSYTHLRAHET